MKRQSAGYGQAGGKGQGQPYSRFQIEGDPTPYIPLWAAGSMVSTVPAHLIGDTGGAYYYGPTKVGGVTNMISNGDVLHSVVVDQLIKPNNNTVRLLLGGGFYDAIFNARQIAVRNWKMFNLGVESMAPVVVNGEFAYQDTTTAASHYGAVTEQFTVAGTVTTVQGNTTVTGAGSNFTTAALTGPYGYVPNMNAPRAGDIIEIVNGGASQYYRIQFITDATHLTIFPAYQPVGGAGQTYRIHRTGYGSWSRNERLLPQAFFVYYAGNVRDEQGAGTIEAINLITPAHFMAPQTTAAVDIQAVDVAYYKSFLLYGFGGAVSWSVAGFPTAIATGFGATDFPALNTSVIALDDQFVCFEFLGDQLVAVFQNSMYLVQATGIVPEFTFYRMAEPTGAFHPGTVDPQAFNNATYTRPAASVRNGFVYVNHQGLQRLNGGLAEPLSTPVDNYDFPGSPGEKDYLVTWDSTTDAVTWSDGDSGRCLILDLERKSWTQLDLSGILGKGMTGNVYMPPGVPLLYRPYSIGYWAAGGSVYMLSSTIENENNFASVVPWTWASPIATLGQVYGGFKFGGFEIWARGTAGSNATLNWSIYGGTDPYHMTLRQGPTSFNYGTGFVDSRAKLGNGMIDDPFIGFVLTGSLWIELTGIVIYPSDSRAGA